MEMSRTVKLIILGITIAVYFIAFLIWGQEGLGFAIIGTAAIAVLYGLILCKFSYEEHTYKLDPPSFEEYLRMQRMLRSDILYSSRTRDPGLDYYLFCSSYNRTGHYSYMDWKQFGIGVLFIVGGVLYGLFGLSICIEKDEYDMARNHPCLEYGDSYLTSIVPMKFHKEEVRTIMDSIMQSATIDELHSFSQRNDSTSQYQKEAKKKINELCSQAYQNAISQNTIGAWTYYKDSIMSYHSNAPLTESNIAEKIQYLMEHGWDTENSAWANAASVDDTWAYNEYLNRYPQGEHSKSAIDAMVKTIANGEHGSLPSMDQNYYGDGPKSSISIQNDTSYELTLLYSGVESKRIVLQPHGSTSISLYNGSYDIAASVTASDVRNYYGTESLRGGSYSVSYYISSGIGGYGGYKLPRIYP